MTIHPYILLTQKYSQEDILESLMDLVGRGLVSVRENNNLRLFDYTQLAIEIKEWSTILRCCRGLIIDFNTGEVVNLSLPKFFNYGENPNDVIPLDLPFKVQEKVDGSCLYLWFYNGIWNTCTRGSFDSEQAQKAREWLKDKDLAGLDTRRTYVFEIIYPENKIVVPYDEQGLVFITSFDKRTGLEHDDFHLVGLFPFVRRTLSFNYSWDSLAERCKTLPATSEGFVVRFENGFRIKFKGEEYIRLHRILSNLTEKNILKSLIDGDDLSTLKASLPEEEARWLETTLYNLYLQENQIFDNLSDFVSANKSLTRKEFAILVNQQNQSTLAFKMLDHLINQKVTEQSVRKEILRSILKEL